MSAAAIRAFLDRHGLVARRDLGQNFLCDARVAERLAASAGVEPGDSVVEVGTGLGILTRALAARAGRVVSLEVDAGLVRALRAEASLPAAVELLHADVLAIDLGALVRAQPPPVRLVANLPYSAATPVLRRLLDLRDALASWSVMVQREVARRILAAPGSPDYGSLAVLHALTVDVRAGLDLRPGAFYPVPRVVSTFLHLTPRVGDALTNRELRDLERLVRAAFAHRRKTLVNSLRACGLRAPVSDLPALLARHGVAARARAQEVAPATWRALAGELAAAEWAGA